MICKHCENWGETISRFGNEDTCLITCPECKRLTWPNLGVNLPAGAAFSIGSSGIKSLLKENKQKIIPPSNNKKFYPLGSKKAFLDKLNKKLKQI